MSFKLECKHNLENKSDNNEEENDTKGSLNDTKIEKLCLEDNDTKNRQETSLKVEYDLPNHAVSKIFKSINVLRAISDLKCGLPITFQNENVIAKTPKTQKFYFVVDFITEKLQVSLNDCNVISTQERVMHGNDDFKLRLPQTKEEEILIKLLKIAEIAPVVACTTQLPSYLENVKILELEICDMEYFFDEFIFDLKLFSSTPINLNYAHEAELFVFKTPFAAAEHYAIKIGKPPLNSPLVRVHSSCYTGDLLWSLRCDCRDQLQTGIEYISEHGGGYLLYLMQEGRGIGLANKVKAYFLQQYEYKDTVESNLCLGFEPDERNFTAAKKMLEFFNVKEISLLTNNPKKMKDLTNIGIKVTRTVATVYRPNIYNKDFLNAKEEKMGHCFVKN